jgi:nucleoside-diphosphate-sugar epimerase
MSILDADMADAITPQLIKPHPNTYTFTKSLGEHVMKTRTGEIPYSVVRPAIVTAAWKEPAGPTSSVSRFTYSCTFVWLVWLPAQTV